MKKETVTVKKDEANPEPVEIIAKSILEIAEGMKKLNATRLNREALVTLIWDHSHVSKKDIRVVLNNLEALESIFLKRIIK